MSNIFKPNEKYEITLRDNPTTGFTWEYTCEHPDTTHEIERKSIVMTDKNLIGASTNLAITFQSTKSDTLKFYHVRKWLNQNLKDLKPDYEYNITIQE